MGVLYCSQNVASKSSTSEVTTRLIQALFSTLSEEEEEEVTSPVQIRCY